MKMLIKQIHPVGILILFFIYTLFMPQQTNATVDIEVYSASRVPAPIITTPVKNKISSSIFIAKEGSSRIIEDHKKKLHVLSYNRQAKGSLISLDTGNITLSSELLAGLNRKGFSATPDGWMVSIDLWPNGGNRHSGIFKLSLDGNFAQIPLVNQLQGLGDIVQIPGKGWFFCDFEAENIFTLPKEGQEDTPWIKAAPPGGLYILGYNPKTKNIYGVDRKGEWPFVSQSALYRINEEKTEQLYVGDQIEGLAYNQGNLFPQGMYLSDRLKGVILRLLPDNSTETIITNLINPSDIRFNQTTGSLYVVCDEKYVLRFGPKGSKRPEGMQAFTPDSIEIRDKNLPNIQVVIDDRSFATNNKGIISVKGLLRGKHQITIAENGYNRFKQEIDISTKATDTLSIPLEPVNYYPLRGRVQLSDQTPLSGAVVVFTPLNNKAVDATPLTFSTNFDGLFTLPALAKGQYTTTIKAPGCEAFQQIVTIPSTDKIQTFQLKPKQPGKKQLRVQVVDVLTNKPVPGAKVQLSEAGPAGFIGEGQVDARGETTLTVLLGRINFAKDNRVKQAGEHLTLTILADNYNTAVIPFSLSAKPLLVLLVPKATIKEKEPNNNLQTAQKLHPGLTVASTIATKGDQDIFTFTLDHPGRFTAVTPQETTLQTVIRLLDKDGKEINQHSAYKHQVNTLGPLDLDRGKYYIQLEEWDNNHFSEQEILLTITIKTTPDALDPNDNKQQARRVEANQEVRGTIFPLKDQDWYHFTATRPGTLQAFLPPTPAQKILYLYDASGEKELTNKAVYDNQPIDLRHDLQAGEYYLCIREWGDNSASLSPYTMKLTYVEDDHIDDPPLETKPLTAVRKLALDSTSANSIYPVKDYDIYKIKLPSAGRLIIEGKSSIQLSLNLQDSNATVLGEKNTYSNQPNKITYDADSQTTVYLIVREWGDNSSSTDLYYLTTSWLGADANDKNQRNDDFASATLVKAGMPIQQTIMPLKDIDYYRVECDHPGFLKVEGSSQGQLHVRWFDQHQKELAGRGYYENSDIDIGIPITAGAYFLELREWADNRASLVPYNLMLIHERAEPGEKSLGLEDPHRLLKKGEAESFSFDQNKDVDVFTYEAQAGEKTVFTITSPMQVMVKITDVLSKKILFERGYYENSKINIPIETKEKSSLIIELTEWANNRHSHIASYIIADTQPVILPLIDVKASGCGYAPGTVCFTTTIPEGSEAPQRIEVDTDLDGQYDLSLNKSGDGRYRFTKPGIYPVDIAITSADGTIMKRHIWADGRDMGDRVDLELSIADLENGKSIENEQDITFYSSPSSGARITRIDCTLDGKPLATMHTPPFTLEMPWLNMPSGKHTLTIRSTDSSGAEKIIARSFQLSEYFGLQPKNNADLTGDNVRITWSGNRFGKAIVRYRTLGETNWKTITGESGRTRSVLLPGLTSGKQYEYQVISGSKPSSIRKFNLLKGLAFGKPAYGININRDYDQRFGISVRNNGAEPLEVRLECGKIQDSLLLVGFVGAGSEDKPFSLQPGEERKFILGLSAQDVITANHSFPVRIVSKSGLSDEAIVNVGVRLPRVKLEWKDLGTVPYGLGKKYRLINHGDTITDLAVFSKNTGIYITPAINHGMLPSGSSTDVTVYPHLAQNFKGITAKLIAKGLNKEFPTTFSVKLAKDEKLFHTYLIPGLDPQKDPQEYERCRKNALLIGTPDPDKVDWSNLEFPEDQDLDGQDDRWYVTNAPNDILWVGDDTDADGSIDFIHADKGADGIFEYSAYKLDDKWHTTNLVEAWLEMGFTLPWNAKSYHKHDVDVVFNDHVIGMLRDTIPNGNYTFRIPPHIIRFDENGTPENNIIAIKTKHLRGGHYVVNSDFRFNFRLTATPVWSIGKSEQEAFTKALAIDGMSLEAADYSISSSDMKLTGPEILETGLDLQVQAELRNLGALSTPDVTVALFDKRPNRKRQEISRATLEDIPVSGKMAIGLPWKSTGGDHQLLLVIDPDNQVEDSDRANNTASFLVSIPGDDEPPILKIIGPKTEQKLAQSVTDIVVEAEDFGGISSVEASIDGGLWQYLAQKGKKEFNGKLLLQPGTHDILIRATDLSGNETEQKITVSFTHDTPKLKVMYPESGSKIQSRTSKVVVKVPSGTVAVGARVNGGPWYQAKLAGGFGKLAVPLRFGKQNIEAMVVQQDGIVAFETVSVECTRQPKQGVNDYKKVNSSTFSPVAIYDIGKVDIFTQQNHVISETE